MADEPTKLDLYVSKLIERIGEDPADWERGWIPAISAKPTNAVTGRPYRGYNTLALGFDAMLRGFEGPAYWAGIKQWNSAGAKVAKGQSPAWGVRWSFTYRCTVCGTKATREPCPKHWDPAHRYGDSPVSSFGRAIAFKVWHAEQLSETGDWEPPADELADKPEPDRLAALDAIATASGANIQHVRMDPAGAPHYTVGTNRITLPDRRQFTSQERYYSTLAHELTHFTGDTSRLNREQSGRFGGRKYGLEELVAELGAAFLLADHGFRLDSVHHIAYLANWLSAIKEQPKRLYLAARDADKARNWLISRADAGGKMAA